MHLLNVFLLTNCLFSLFDNLLFAPTQFARIFTFRGHYIIHTYTRTHKQTHTHMCMTQLHIYSTHSNETYLCHIYDTVPAHHTQFCITHIHMKHMYIIYMTQFPRIVHNCASYILHAFI